MTYIAFLKGINVSGHRIIKMAELKAMFEAMGYKNVRTYIQSGNVVFETPTSKNESLVKIIEPALEKELGYNVTVVVRTTDEIKKIISDFPFTKVKNYETFKTDVAFLSSEPDKSAAKELEAHNSKDEMFKVAGCNVYSIRTLGFPDALIGKDIIEKTLKVKATVRNWNTINKILDI